jgi:hypothetical protein
MITNSHDDFDAIIIGSDTLWDFEVPSFYEKHEIYMGDIFKNTSIYTYAVSLSNTSLDYVARTEFFSKSLKNFSRISVRDLYTQNVVASLCSNKVVRVCDPTMLLKAGEYCHFMGNIQLKNYVFLYIFSDETITEGFITQITNFARKNNLRIISFGEFRSWADKNVPYSPKMFLDYISRADYVITNTFHGSVFSAIFHRQVAILGEEKNKVVEITNLLGLDMQLLSQSDNLEKCLLRPIDHNRVESIIEEERKKGIDFLTDCLDEASIGIRR